MASVNKAQNEAFNIIAPGPFYIWGVPAAAGHIQIYLNGAWQNLEVISALGGAFVLSNAHRYRCSQAITIHVDDRHSGSLT